MRNWTLIILLMLLFCSCKNNQIKRPEKPGNLLSEDKMVEVIYDMSIISAAKGVNKRILENKGISPQAYVYDKHNIDSLQFALSNEYYAYDLKAYQQMYDRVKVKLQLDKDHFNEIIEADKTKKDSVSEKNRARRDSIIKARSLEAKDGL